MDLSKHHSKHRNVPFHTVCQPSFFLLIYCKLPRSDGEGQIYAKLLVPLCDLVTPLFIILCKSMRTVSEFNLLALEGASRPSSKLIVNMFSLCTS